MLWDRGSYQLLGDFTVEQQFAEGDFQEFHLAGEKLRGDFALVRTKRGKGNEWLLQQEERRARFAKPGWGIRRSAMLAVWLAGGRRREIAQGLAAGAGEDSFER